MDAHSKLTDGHTCRLITCWARYCNICNCGSWTRNQHNQQCCKMLQKPALGHPICGSIINLLSAWHLREPDRWRRTWIMRLGSSQRLDICFLNKLRFNAFYGSSVSRLWNASCYGSDSLTSKIHLHQILHLQIAYLLVPKMHVQFLNLNVQWHKGQEICIPATRYAFSSPQDFQICILEWYQK